MDDVLKTSGLDHLCDTLSSFTVSEAMGLLDAGRPKLLERLKEIGVSKLPDRQAVAKAVANAKRGSLGMGEPVLVVLYSTGLAPPAGRQLMQPIIDRAHKAGMTDVVVLDHCNEAPYAGNVGNFEEYVLALRESVYQAGDNFRSRPLVIVAHSNGAVGGYGLARLLQAKVRALCVLGRRPPSTPLLPEVLGLQTTSEVFALSLHELSEKMTTVYANPILKGYTRNPDASSWQPQIRAAVESARDQYGSPCVLCAPEDIEAAIAKPGSDVPAAARIAAPVYAVASKQETAEGETAEKMESWAKLTSSTFEWLVRDVDVPHMDLPKNEAVIERVIARCCTPHLGGAGGGSGAVAIS